MTANFSCETIPLHSTASGTTFEIDVWRYQHPEATKTVYLQAGIHGIELTGIPVVHEFMQEIEEQQLAYNFICVPLSNPMGLDSQIMGVQTGYNNLHTNQQNCWNWNRIGNLEDEPSQEGNWIKTLLDLSAPADIILDLHTAGVETVAHIYYHESEKVHVSGLGILHLLSWKIPSHSFSDTNFQRGKVALTFELSCSRSVQDEQVEESLIYLRRFFGLLPKVEGSRIWQTESQLKKWYSPDGGVLCWHINAGDAVTEGDVIATLYNRKGKLDLESPYSGVLLLKNPIHAPHQRQELAKFLVE
ncbi:MAG: succinylglutamate desuccinylase/aspartoacylase family protein [SAR324 cluster bacterium]|nr:succinylglutamate desuccinylase/aspartoacylase family protein [SAR324 cluster bacterium]MBL7035367.1 succinylglutamate desuccinylase/aspartoacylase family protein [SAR324 cluster bacterium]